MIALLRRIFSLWRTDLGLEAERGLGSPNPSPPSEPSEPVAALPEPRSWSYLPERRLAWLRSVIPLARASQRKWGVPASVTIAQAILESAWGERDMGVFNVFGIKGRGPAGTVSAKTHEWLDASAGPSAVLAGFRAYHSLEEAFDDHGRILGTLSYYAKARKKLPDARAYARALMGVYATDPDYGEKLVHLIERFELDGLDIFDVSDAPQGGRTA